MKRMRKLAGIVLAMVMVLSMSLTALAVEDGGITAATTKIIINDGDVVSNAEYSAYKLLNATDGGDGKFAYTVNATYRAALLKALDLTETTEDTVTDAEIVAAIGALQGDAIQTFANAVYAEVKTATADATATNNEFSDVPQGYYLIVETKLGSTTEGHGSDTYSLVMLDTKGLAELTVTTKEDVPTVEKEVKEINDSTGDSSWGESADYDIGDTIEYQITGTVSDKYADYKSYYYSFEDSMDAGLTLDKESIKVTIGDTDVTTQFAIDTATAGKFTATANLKELSGVTITANTEIVVTYKATLNEDAVSGTTGNKNEVVLKYENNPYHEGDGNPETPDKPDEPGETPKDIAVVFTFDGIVNKVDVKGDAVNGAGFTLYKWVVEYDDDGTVKEDSGAWTAVGAEVKPETGNEFKWEGLDAGQYKLEETTVPAGYNKADDIFFNVVATYDDSTDPDTLTGLKVTDVNDEIISEGDEAAFSATVDSGVVETNVVNTTGVELPSTGGIGTTIFYIVGGVLVLGAVVVLIARRRMSMED